MLDAAIVVMRERGAGGLSIDEVLARSGCPRGSVYHHFPGGRAELQRRTLEYAGESYAGMIERAAAKGGSEAVISRVIAFWTRVLTESEFRAGCPVAAAAVNPAVGEEDLASRAAEIYLVWRDAVAAAYIAEGATAEHAEVLANTALSTVHGAITLCRITRSLGPLESVAESLRLLAASAERRTPADN
ncbi:hypothetical protein BST33_04370 [Mycolicibacter minnesotensis]|uniref:HTH tetR-type domain-containing protein n=3 Tax=Mycobacteriaceae TaxID=1762 RepID=A0AA91M7A2_9MYCO|nr:hypothetical protein BST33_04370 [Mycolicibacter minnesotensis]